MNVVIVGSGPAGYTAAIYAGRAHLRPLVFEARAQSRTCAHYQLLTAVLLHDNRACKKVACLAAS